jgi:hypothetical protein
MELSGYPVQIGETCIYVGENAIQQKKSPFCSKNGKRVDEIHHCEKMGLVEIKSNSYSPMEIEEKFIEHKQFIETKFSSNQCCKVGYFVLQAKRLSGRASIEWRVNRQGQVCYKFGKKGKKPIVISNCPVYFVRK